VLGLTVVVQSYILWDLNKSIYRNRPENLINASIILHQKRLFFQMFAKMFVNKRRSQFSNFRNLLIVNVPRTGFEPMTYCLEGSCSIQLSYRGKIFYTLVKSKYKIFKVIIALTLYKLHKN
jgi:hypothetical protein